MGENRISIKGHIPPNTFLSQSKICKLLSNKNIRDPAQEKILSIGWNWVEQSLQETRKIFRKESDAKLKD
ncbi:hypothetical protein LptCag_0747 [Leptospirillum ferriphilum]|jgi:hypothetical protein|uniref:Uncharacterized protein n=2 Tax=Leptospirillum TaxID=179 RepID=A0A094YLN0_9BACT|nr:MAG: Hypothetical protein CGL2_11346079 [Leptospirillum sp. Group II '5-way CG']KGA94121.1 hypothetical protein LptCag_0747 [Leptospirillum ferriphilum]